MVLVEKRYLSYNVDKIGISLALVKVLSIDGGGGVPSRSPTDIRIETAKFGRCTCDVFAHGLICRSSNGKFGILDGKLKERSSVGAMLFSKVGEWSLLRHVGDAKPRVDFVSKAHLQAIHLTGEKMMCCS